MPASDPSSGSLRRRVDRFIHHAWVELLLIVLILASVSMLFVEGAFAAGSDTRRLLEQAGDSLTAVFIVELSLRFWVAPKKSRFFARYWLDILAVVPIFRPLRFLRILMLLRIFRAGALFRRRLSAFRGAMRATLQEVTMLLTVTTALVLAGAVVLSHTEGVDNPEFSTVGSALWYAVASTIGGEPIFAEPTTVGGKAVTVVLMLGGLTLFGLFIGTVSAAMMARLSKSMEVYVMDLDELQGHTVVCGWNRAAPTVLEELFSTSRGDRPVVLVTEEEVSDVELPAAVRSELLYRFLGDYTRVNVLKRAGIEQAASAILLTDEQLPRSDQDRDARTVLAALTIEKLASDIFTVAELTNRENQELLKMAGVEEIVVAEEYGAVVMGSAERNRGIVSIVDEILTTRYGNAFQKVVVGPKTAGSSIGDLHQQLKQQEKAILLAHIHCEDGVEKEVVVNPGIEARVQEGDRVVVLSSEPPRLT